MELESLPTDVNKTKLVDVLPTPVKPIVTVPETATVREALAALHKNNILSCPVLDSNSQVVALLDILDVLGGILIAMPTHLLVDEPDVFFKQAQTQGNQFFNESVKSIMGKSNRNNVVVLIDTDPLITALTQFAEGVHRILIVSSTTRQVTHVFSQSLFLRVLYLFFILFFTVR
eukprot:TRINITY_DN973_c0_g1_i1.p1 TRINITY_DN973_c0_g1~~TRINITY_DN973_c0_g1_i1.p1  ORF type:complete len:174 (-),score=16.25 TRINITY_DN973_c0_g1_i1:639-1160(-)